MKAQHTIVALAVIVVLIGVALHLRQYSVPGREAYERGVGYAHSGKFQQAAAAFTEALRLSPGDAKIRIGRGVAYRELHAFDRAREDFTEAERLVKRDALADTGLLAEIFAERGMTYHMQGKGAPALADYQRALKIAPDAASLNNQLAWLLATSPDPAVHDGNAALRHARKACDQTGWRDAAILDTLAAAYARSGDFEQALHWQRKAVELADDDLRAELESRVTLYESKRAYAEILHVPAGDNAR